MPEDATSPQSDPTPDTTSTPPAGQPPAPAAAPAPAPSAATDPQPTPGADPDEKLGEAGVRALQAERHARRDAERQLTEMRARLEEFEGREKTELQKAQEAAQRYEQELNATRTANARLMAAALHNIPPDLIDLLGSGTDEEIDARAKLLATKLTAAPTTETPAPAPPPAPTRPVEALTPGAKPASEVPADPNEMFRHFVSRRRAP